MSITRSTRSAVEILNREFANDPDYRAGLQEERAKLQAARAIYEARTEAGLTQQQLAQRIGTTQSVIARLEDADYEGHTLKMLNRIAAALGQRVEVHFLPAANEPRSATPEPTSMT